jgi:ABC-type nickel/cobalt efflux system permease component RcnA
MSTNHDINLLVRDDSKTDSKTDEIKNEVKIWTSCCVRVNKSVVIYFSQLFIGVLVLAFAFYQLVRSNFQCDQSSPYLSLISFVLGTYVARISK